MSVRVDNIKSALKKSMNDIGGAIENLKQKGTAIAESGMQKGESLLSKGQQEASRLLSMGAEKTKSFYKGALITNAEKALQEAETALADFRGSVVNSSSLNAKDVALKDKMLVDSVNKAQSQVLLEKIKRGAMVAFPLSVGTGYVAGEVVNSTNPVRPTEKLASSTMTVYPDADVAIHSKEKRDGVPRLLAGAVATGLGGAAYGAHKINNAGQALLGSTLVGDETLALADSLSDIKSLKSSKDFISQYADKGHRLVNTPAYINLPGIKASNGYEAVMGIRTSPMYGSVLKRLGMGKDVDAESLAHYEAFRDGQDVAVKQMFDETFGGVKNSARNKFLADYKTARWDAIYSAAKQGVVLDRESIKNEVLKKMTNGQSITDRNILNEMRDLVSKTENILSKQDGYDDYLRNVYRAIGENNSIWLGELDASKEYQFRNAFKNGTVDSYENVADRILRDKEPVKSSFRTVKSVSDKKALRDRLLGKNPDTRRMLSRSGQYADDIVSDYASNMLRRSFAKAPDSYASFGDAVRTLRSLGKSMVSGGRWKGMATLGAAGLGGYALAGNVPRKVYEATRNKGTERRLRDQGINAYDYYS